MSSKYKTAQELLDEEFKPEFKKEKIRISITKDDVLKHKSQEKPAKKEPEKKEAKETKPKKKKTRPVSIKPKFGKLSKLLDSADKKAIKDFLTYSAFYGVLLNFSVFVIFRIPFTFYSWLGWGIGLWFVENKFAKILIRIIRK